MIVIQRTGRRLSATAITFLIFAAGVVVAGEPPVLEVAASPITLQLTVAVRQSGDSDLAESLGLIELDVTGAAHSSALPVQMVPAAAADGTKLAGSQQLLAVIPPNDAVDGTRRFRLLPSESESPGDFRFEAVSDASLGLWQGDHPVFVYNHGDITSQGVPENDSRRRRGCYVHPVWGLGGEVITDDFPEDHYHHHGIFWAWPHVRIGETEYDLWMYRDIQQRFVRWICRETGPVAAVLAVENGWFVGDRKVMIERVWMRTFVVSQGRRVIDITLTLVPVDRAITLQGAAGKSYGGLTVRFAPRDDKQTVITVPAGRASEDLPDTPLPWADFTSQFVGANAPSGATVMIDPTHPDFPPTWLTRHYGALCVGYPGVQAKTFPPGKAFVLNYRVSIHDATAELVDLVQVYDAYTAALKAHWTE